MKSATSSSKSGFYPTLWKKNMARFWPIWAVYGLVWLFALPLSLLTFYRGSGPWVALDEGANYFANIAVLEYAGELSVVMVVGFSVLCAMAVFSYLYQSKSAGMFHALPVRREGLFLTNYLSGLSFMLLPAGFVFLMTVLAELAKGCLNVSALALWLGCQVCYALFFYSFAVFCAMFTGHILALPAFYAILNGLAMGLYMLVSQVLQEFVFGFTGIDGIEKFALWLTPVAKLNSQTGARQQWDDGLQHYVSANFQGFGYVLVYALVGIVLAGLALVLYRRRHLESAGDIVSVSWVKPIFKFGVGFCAGLAFGSVLYAWLGWNLPRGAWTLLGFMLLCGAAGYFVAEMLLQKSFWVFKRSWKGCVILLCAMAAATAVMELDLTGFERRVPDPQRVVSLTVIGPHTYPYDDSRGQGIDTSDPELIRLVTALHEAVVQEKDALTETTEWYEDVEQGTSTQLRITYTLDTGAEVRRRYDNLIITGDMLADPDSAASRLQAIVNRPEATWYGYFPEDISTWRLVDAYLTVPSYLNTAEMTEIELEQYGVDRGDASAPDTILVEDAQRAVPQEGWDDLFSAVQSDLRAGRIGQRYLFSGTDRLTNCYYNDLRLTFYVPDATGGTQGGDWPRPSGQTAAVKEGTCSVTITVQKTAADTLAVLDRLGLTESLVLQSELD